MNDFDPCLFPFPPEWLAAYADGELPADLAARVDAFLHANPELQSCLHEQLGLSPVCESFRQAIVLPPVAPHTWEQMLREVHAHLDAPPASAVRPAHATPPKRRDAPTPLLHPWLLGSLLCLLLLGVILPARPAPEVREGLALHRVPEGPIVLAAADEVQILGLDETATVGLVVGRHPLADSPLVLASFEDVQLQGVSPDAQGDLPQIQMNPREAGAVPMIWSRPEPAGPRER